MPRFRTVHLYRIDTGPLGGDPAPEDQRRRLLMVTRWFSPMARGADKAPYYGGAPDTFRAEQPMDVEDAAAGGFCTKSGFWFPGSHLGRLDGGSPVGDRFETSIPETEEFPYE